MSITILVGKKKYTCKKRDKKLTWTNIQDILTAQTLLNSVYMRLTAVLKIVTWDECAPNRKNASAFMVLVGLLVW